MGVWEGFWSERAGRAEQDADRMATQLAVILERQGHLLPHDQWAAVQDCLRDWKGNAEARHRALPAGPTRIGNLASGGIHL